METSRNLEVSAQIQNKLIGLVDKTLANPTIGPKLQVLLQATKLEVVDLKQGVLSYTLSKPEFDFGNDHYKSLLSRLTLHFHNIVEGSYHHDRHQMVLSFMEEVIPKKIMDIGYGVPSSYHLSYLAKHPEATAELLDMYPSAEEFAKILIQNEAPEVLPRINFRTYDMDSGEFPGKADAYLFLDSIEHTKKPSEYLAMILTRSNPEAHFIFSLPVSKKSPNSFHNAEWLTDYEARKWLENAGLAVIRDGIVHTNPTVDFFAELKVGGFHNYIALTKKNQHTLV